MLFYNYWLCILFSIIGNFMLNTVSAGLLNTLLSGNIKNNDDINKNDKILNSLTGINLNLLGQGRNEGHSNFQNNEGKSYGFGNLGYPNIANHNLLNQGLNTGLGNSLQFQNKHPLVNSNNHISKEQLQTQVTEAQKMLDRLKEINRQKLQNQIDPGQNPITGAIATLNSTETVQNNGTELGVIQDNGNNNIKQKPTDETTVILSNNTINNVERIKSLTVKRFWYQVQPVVPEHEVDKYYMTIFYEN